MNIFILLNLTTEQEPTDAIMESSNASLRNGLKNWQQTYMLLIVLHFTIYPNHLIITGLENLGKGLATLWSVQSKPYAVTCEVTEHFYCMY